jgi:glycosyl transferase family 2/LysM domain-containing protein
MPGSRSCRRALVALLLAGAGLSVGGALTAAAAATPAASPAAQPGLARPHASALLRTWTAPVTVPTYTVRAGDNLSVIAMRHRYPGGWQRLYAHNRTTVGRDPDLIHPDQVLRLPSLSPQPSRKPAPAARPAAVTPPRAPAGSVPQPVETAAGSAPSSVRGLIQPAGVVMAILGLVLAALTVLRRRQRRSERPITSSRAAPERRPVPASRPDADSRPSPGPTPTRVSTPNPTSVTDPPSGRTPIPAVPKQPVSFSLVVVADGQQEQDLAALLRQLGGLDYPQLGIVVVVGQDDPAARSTAEEAGRRFPGRITVVTDGQRPRNAATSIDSALPACHGELTGVLGATKVHPELLDRVAGHVRDHDATLIRIGAQLQSCWWSSSPAPGRFRLRLVPGRGQLVFVRTELLRTQTNQDERPTSPAAGRGRAPDDELRLHLARLRVLRKMADAHLDSEADPQQPDGFIRLLLAELDAVDRIGGELLDAGSRRRAGAV